MATNFLAKIIAHKIKKSKEKKKDSPFKKRILNPSAGDIAVIAEIKFASPSAGVFGSKEELISRALSYEQAKADAISIITEEKFFKGEISFISQIKPWVSLPILQKDFVIDPYQVYEAKIAGADAILLIAKIVTKTKLKQLVCLAKELGLEPVVEVSEEKDLEKVLATATFFVGVNARDLESFQVNLNKACQLAKKIPKRFALLGFSGIKTRKEVEKYLQCGAKGVLVGTSLMQTKNSKRLISILKKADEN